MAIRFLALSIENEFDVLAARQRARDIAAICGFALQDQARVSTSVSELARNVYNYAGKGRIEYSIEGATAPQLLKIVIEDQGPGIPHIKQVLSGGYQSPTGMGLGVIGAKRLMDRFDITTNSSGTTITLHKFLPATAPLLTPAMIGSSISGLSELAPNISLSEVQHQNRELLRTLDELNARQKELISLTQELEDTNRGVVALYAELDEKASHLRRADELKSRFLSNMSHEFRTPLNSIRALAKLLLDRMDGELTSEQEVQVQYILKGAVSLSDLVNDLLDIAKIEAGKTEIKPTTFFVSEMISALRGMLKPLLISNKLALNFTLPAQDIEMFQDEPKISQILRNFISNSLKFTEVGSIDVSVSISEDQCVTFSVKDTGLGIAPEYLELIFEEFSQVENRLQKGVKGTGLGLPLCKNLATLLKGKVEVTSTLGEGSTFSVTVPAYYKVINPVEEALPELTVTDDRLPVMIIEDEAYEQLLYERYLADSEFRAVPARSLREANALWGQVRPVAVLLDILLKGEDSWRWLAELKQDEQRNTVPVIIASSVEDERKGLALGADAYFHKPMLKADLLASLRQLLRVQREDTLTALSLVSAPAVDADTLVEDSTTLTQKGAK
jgi:signal transduction histidine kinase/ActR/RegA family two-component response regulator